MPGPFSYPYMVRVRLLEPQPQGLGSVHRLHGTIGRSRCSNRQRVRQLEGTVPGLPSLRGETGEKGT
jgi:hypothetical protein